jgi:hypothetical protein
VDGIDGQSSVKADKESERYQERTCWPTESIGDGDVHAVRTAVTSPATGSCSKAPLHSTGLNNWQVSEDPSDRRGARTTLMSVAIRSMNERRFITSIFGSIAME